MHECWIGHRKTTDLNKCLVLLLNRSAFIFRIIFTLFDFILFNGIFSTFRFIASSFIEFFAIPQIILFQFAILFSFAAMEGIKVPVPKPRRHILVDNEMNNKASYENVSIDLINKNFDIKNENLQNNSKTKLPLNKQFLIPSASGVAAPVDNLHMVNVLTEMNDLQSSKDNNKNLTSTLDEVNNLNSIYNDDNTMDDIDRKPVPAPRRSASVKCDNRTVGPSTGAISKMKSASNLSPTKERFDNSKCSGSYSLVGESSDSVDSSNSKFNLRKTYSNSSLSSSQSSSSNVDNSARYHTTSPG